MLRTRFAAVQQPGKGACPRLGRPPAPAFLLGSASVPMRSGGQCTTLRRSVRECVRVYRLRYCGRAALSHQYTNENVATLRLQPTT